MGIHSVNIRGVNVGRFGQAVSRLYVYSGKVYVQYFYILLGRLVVFNNEII
jgi:hypothetical protein